LKGLRNSLYAHIELDLKNLKSGALTMVFRDHLRNW